MTLNNGTDDKNFSARILKMQKHAPIFDQQMDDEGYGSPLDFDVWW